MVIEVIRSTKKCPKQQVVYRYLPRTFKEDQNEPVFVTDVFKTMFSQPGVWEKGLGSRQSDRSKVGEINKFFVSQF